MYRIRNWVLALASGCIVFALAGLIASAQVSGGKQAVLLTIEGAIGFATADYFARGVETAEAIDAKLIVLVMDTPGGLVEPTRDIIKAILGSPVPVVTYVSPSGSHAASAGTYILLASHIAAMAPATNVGSATPVQVGRGTPIPKPGEQPDDPDADKPENGQPAPDPASALEMKSLNDMIAYIRGLAELRGRNADWAEDAVRNAANLPASEALEMNVIDVIADNMTDLFEQIDGRVVDVSGLDFTLDTSGLIVERIDPDWRTRLLETITHPNVAYILMLIGIYGLLFEGYNPGAIVPGVVGAICLLLALFAFQVLSVNYAGLLLIVLGLILMISEVFVPSFGALGIGGVLSFVIGSIILMDTDVPGYGVDRTLIGSIALVGSGVVMGIVWFAVRARQMPIVTGRQEMIGSIAQAVSDTDANGTVFVFVHGENWTAHSQQSITSGDSVRITAMHGLKLEVEPHPDGGN